MTNKRKLFVEYYLGEAQMNATEAARLAGFRQPHSQGSRLLENVEIQEAIKGRVEEAAMPADEVLKELTDIGRADWHDFLTIKRNRLGEEVDVMLRLTDKLKALELLGKYHSLFTDKTEVTGKDGGPIRIVKAEELTDDELAAIANNK